MSIRLFVYITGYVINISETLKQTQFRKEAASIAEAVITAWCLRCSVHGTMIMYIFLDLIQKLVKHRAEVAPWNGGVENGDIYCRATDRNVIAEYCWNTDC